MDQQALSKAFERIQQQAEKDQAQAELAASISESFSAGYALGKLNKYSSSNSHAASIRVIYQKGVGVSTTESLDGDSLLDCYKEALQSAKDLQSSTEVDELLGEIKSSSFSNLYNDSVKSFTIENKLNWAKQLESSALEFSESIKSVPYSGYADSITDRYLYNTKGLRLHSRSSGAQAYTYAIGTQGDQSVSAYEAQFVRNVSDLKADAVAAHAAKSAVELLGAKVPKTGKYRIVLDKQVAQDLVGAMSDHFSAKSVAEGGSRLNEKIGKKVFSDKISIIDDPNQTNLSGARPFDSEGVLSKTNTIVENGVLKTFLTNMKYAKKFNLANTGNASGGAGEMDISPSNIVVQKGMDSISSLLSAADEVIHVTRVDAIHSGFDDVTGDFSLPAVGFLYQKGQRAYPVNQFVLSGNIFDVLKNVDGVSNQWPKNNDSVMCPDLSVPELSVAGQ